MGSATSPPSRPSSSVERAQQRADPLIRVEESLPPPCRKLPEPVNTIHSLSRSDNYLEINPDAAATALIAKCRAVISAPFTSTALIGRDLGKPSIYYDPHGLCDKDDRAAHGIPVVSGRVELLAWLAALEP